MEPHEEEEAKNRRLDAIWRQKQIPVLYKEAKGEPLKLKLPWHPDNYNWVRGEKRTKPIWLPKYKAWEIPAGWFNEIIDKALNRYGRIYVIQPYNRHKKCAPACMTAKGHDCDCSCMGEFHGSDCLDRSWKVVSDTFAVQRGWTELSCRLIDAYGTH